MKKIIFTLAIISFLVGCKEPNIEYVQYNGSQKEAIFDNILKRRSIRKYTNQQVSQGQIDTIMRSAIFAPSALNKQPWEIRVVQNPDILKEINQRFLNFAQGKEFQGSAAQYKDPKFSIFHGAPTLIIIGGDKENASSQMDIGISLQNILLSAHALGLGTCPLGTLSRVLNEPENKDILKLLNIPDGYNISICTSLGYPAENPPAPVRYAEKAKIIK